MYTGLYSAAIAMDTATARHEVAAANLAHSHQIGYRRRIIQQSTFEDALSDVAQQNLQDPASATEGGNGAKYHVDFRAGAYKRTGRTLDLALQGDAFFVVDGPDGPLYTRSGAFHVTAEGQLVTIDQLPVRGDVGNITLPPGTTPQTVHVTADGGISADGVPVGQLQIQTFDDLTQLQTEGASLFSVPDGVFGRDADAQVLQGFVEQANVTPIDELVNIMIGSRQYEAAQKALTTIAEAVQQHVGVG